MGVTSYSIDIAGGGSSWTEDGIPGTSTAHTVVGLSPDTEYIFTVKAHDEAGNESEDNPQVTETTDPAPVASFYRGINLGGGGSVTIGGNTFDPGYADNVAYTGAEYNLNWIPWDDAPTDPAERELIDRRRVRDPHQRAQRHL
ncbi:fibronectin type III domain-containing protein [Flammeovirgaceae bacterium SG7u.111]|nr:fibronectin type III domain-containing protein [Flammeovirgaceae bacterium SG7u.132]WPO33953.1 fibronectin type III domain-containing protein [Flammeovirgaceae bacterium SG7u.111]